MATCDNPKPVDQSQQSDTSRPASNGQKAIAVRTVKLPGWVKQAMDKSIDIALNRYSDQPK